MKLNVCGLLQLGHVAGGPRVNVKSGFSIFSAKEEKNVAGSCYGQMHKLHSEISILQRGDVQPKKSHIDRIKFFIAQLKCVVLMLKCF